MGFGETFLVFPDLFPTRRGGEAWGTRTLHIDFVGGPYRFCGLDDRQVEACRERFGDLAIPIDPNDLHHRSEPAAAVEVSLFRAGPQEFHPADTRGHWNYTFDLDFHPETVRLAGVDFMGRLDRSTADGEATWRPTLWTCQAEGVAFQCLFENFFRVIVAYRLLDLGGVLLHSAGIASRGVAHLFLGPSGAGKSTISRLGLASGRTVLSDDMNALCPPEDSLDGATPRVEKLPFAGDLGRTPTPRDSYPLATLNRLRQGPDALNPLPTASALASLVACAPFVNGDPHRLDTLMGNLQRILHTFPAHELTFSKDGTFWPLLEA